MKKKNQKCSMIKASMSVEEFRRLYKNFRPEISSEFKLTKKQIEEAMNWYAELKPEIVKIQKRIYPKRVLDRCIRPDEPYYGVNGGGLTYSFTPTDLGTVIVITEATTGKKINLTDYESW